MSQSPPPNVQTLPLMWGAFIMAHLSIAGVTSVVPAEPTGDTSWAPLLGLVALVPAGLSVQGGLIARAASNAQTWFLIRFALGEAAGLIGVVAWLAAGDRAVQLGCAAVGLVAHLFAFPSAGAQAAFEDRRR